MVWRARLLGRFFSCYSYPWIFRQVSLVCDGFLQWSHQGFFLVSFRLRALWNKGWASRFCFETWFRTAKHNSLPAFFLPHWWENLMDWWERLLIKNPSFHLFQAAVYTCEKHINPIVFFMLHMPCIIIGILLDIIVAVVQLLPQSYHLVVVDNNLMISLFQFKNLGGILQIRVTLPYRIPYGFCYRHEHIGLSNRRLHRVEKPCHY